MHNYIIVSGGVLPAFLKTTIVKFVFNRQEMALINILERCKSVYTGIYYLRYCRENVNLYTYPLSTYASFAANKVFHTSVSHLYVLFAAQSQY